MNKNKKLLTIYDLEDFYSKYKRSTHFSSKEAGYKLAVQVPAVFDFKEVEEDTLMYCELKCFHIGKNANKSNVTEEGAKKAMKHMAYKPILANFCEYTDENGEVVKDFTSHDMEITEDGKIKYFEHQIGCLTADEPWIEYDEKSDKDFVHAYGAIPKDYTDAEEIIKRKKGTKVSVELYINELEYNAKTKIMNLTDVTVAGVTCLGSNVVDGEKKSDVQEGMRGARLDIKDFSEANNSKFSSLADEENTKLIETLENLSSAITTIASKFNIKENQGKEDEINVEDEIKVEEKENFEETEEVTEMEDFTVKEETETETEADDTEETEETVETPEVVEPEEEVEEEKETDKSEKKYTKEFSLSFDEITYALYQLLEEQTPIACHYICKVYEDRFIYELWDENYGYYGQNYIKENDTISFVGERYELFPEFITVSEKAEIEKMRSEYALVVDKLKKYEIAEINAEKDKVLSDSAYAEFTETESFKEIKNNIETYSVEELKTACELAFAKEVRSKKEIFASKNEEKTDNAPKMFAFARQEESSSFLDSLLKKKN